MGREKMKILVSDHLKEACLEIFKQYRKYLIDLVANGEAEEISCACIELVSALNRSYDSFSWEEQHFISEAFMRDFVNYYLEEDGYMKFLAAESLPRKYRAKCLYDSDIVAEVIYGGSVEDVSVEKVAGRKGIPEQAAQKIYDTFWEKTIEYLK